MIVQTDADIKENYPLAPLTTLKIGGSARFFVRAESEEQVVRAFEFARENSLDVFVLGGGSNVLISDNGFDGLVLQIALKGISQENADNSVFVTAQAGEDWDVFVAKCVGENLAGVECLSGIPGFVGGTPVQNVGAYGQEVSETIVSVRCYDRESGEIVELTNAECGFEYRKSIFNSTERERYVVLAVTYRLIQDGEPKIVYKDLREYFGMRGHSDAERGESEKARKRESESEPPASAGGFLNETGTTKQLEITRNIQPTNPRSAICDPQSKNPPANAGGSAFGATLQGTRNAVLAIRRAKSMVIDEGDPNSCSAGSFFKNPIVPLTKYSEIVATAEREVPKFAVNASHVKIPAAWLIENAGFHKGFAWGNAGISSKHTLALINRGGAAAAEIVALKNLIQQKVAAKFGIELKPEPVFVGFS